ncbi:hypothetical protein VTO73DRAFT_9849 [Trametes versicolor]
MVLHPSFLGPGGRAVGWVRIIIAAAGMVSYWLSSGKLGDLLASFERRRPRGLAPMDVTVRNFGEPSLFGRCGFCQVHHFQASGASYLVVDGTSSQRPS